MKRKSLALLTSVFVFIPALAGCNNDAKKWNYSKDEIGEFYELRGIDTISDTNRAISYSGKEYFFDGQISIDDIKVYNHTKLQEDAKSGTISLSSDYIPYKVLCNYEATVVSVENSYASIKVSYIDNSSDIFKALVHKDANVTQRYLEIEGAKEGLGQTSDVEIDTEEDYIMASPSWAVGKNVINLIGGITQLVVGSVCGVPTAQAGGIFTILTSLGDLFGAKGEPTIQDVLNKLNEMDKKLDDIQAQINRNHQELIDMNLLLELGISQEILATYENGISQFKADYAKPIDLLLKQFRYYIDDCFKDLVKQSKTIDMYFVKENNKWTLQSFSDTDHTNSSHVSLTVSDWTNAKKCLQNNNDIVGTGFMDEVQTDILSTIQDNNLLQGMTKSELSNHALLSLTDEFGYLRYKDSRNDAIQIGALAEQFAEEISTGTIVRNYVERLKIIYNFVGESKQTLKDAFAGLCRQLDIYCGQAAEALRFAKENATSLANAWAAARSYISDAYNSIKETSSNYCYTTSCKLKADFFKIKYNLSYTNPGNDCVFHSSVNLEKIEEYNEEVKYTKQNLNEYDSLESTNYKRIVNKFNLLKSSGILGSSTTFTSYLLGNEVLSKDTAYAFSYLLHKGIVTEETNDKYASVITQRNMTDSNKNVKLTCVARGNPDGEYFSIGWKGNFRGHEDDEYWSGKMLETTFFSGDTGAVINNETRVCAYATYAESHALWIDDEFWAFTDCPNGNYFYMISREASSNN